ncbi:cytochrome C [Helicobacter cholecystus]|uniref:Cytochrome C n=1 Tax=Helicobacter cholecystus TaxID=45498 RepID=A0A3D8IXI2_9HELI|nr:c-type cytochrome [Helicobacter cholecystus]RDU69690.1 cytochrome C [Helicobacter cholecystus]VEJ24256.1 cytochrome c553 [Helicobacter cholecystus]
MKKFVAIFALGLASMLFAEAPAVYKKCTTCHGVDGKKVGVAPKPIAGLSKQQAIDLLTGYKNKTIKTPKANTMFIQVKNLSNEDINTLAEYIATLK